MRRLWTEPSLSFEDRFERVTRAGRLADGWFAQAQPEPDLEHAVGVVHSAAVEAGRDPATIGMEGRVSLSDVGIDGVAGRVHAWRAAGATHVAIGATRAGLSSIEDHLAVLSAIADALALRPVQ